MHRFFFSIVILALGAMFSPLSATADETFVAENEVSYTTFDGTEISGYHFPAEGDTLIVWVGSSYNVNNKIYNMAHELSKQGLEVWLIDYAEALFAPHSSNFMRNLNAQYVVDLINAAHKQTGKKIVLLTRAYGAIPTMRGATLWQQQNPDKTFLTGAVLFSPDFYSEIPELGLDPEYLPVTRYTTLPIVIYQGGRRGTAWQFPRLLKQLQESNNNVYLKIMPGVSGIFYSNDLGPETLAQIKRLPVEMTKVVRLLEQAENRQQPNGYTQPKTLSNARPDIRLKPFKGNTEPPAFKLENIDGKPYEFSNQKHKVMVINFWATWCPPCVEEIPSLNRLKEKMKDKPFELISINYAEPKPLITDFLKQVNVEFPVLLDKDAKVSGEWNVIAFPSTFVVGPDGKIHYGVNAAILWDSPEVISLLNKLLEE